MQGIEGECEQTSTIYAKQFHCGLVTVRLYKQRFLTGTLVCISLTLAVTAKCETKLLLVLIYKQVPHTQTWYDERKPRIFWPPQGLRVTTTLR